jgi:DNA-binding transcriptional MerR regulator
MQIGLLKPSARSSGGHRVYSERDAAVLYRIIPLRGLGLRLDQIKEFGQSAPDSRAVLVEANRVRRSTSCL